MPPPLFWVKLSGVSAIEFVGVSKRYGARSAVSELSLRLDEGHALGLLGPNGAGKTTALRLLLGFCSPTAGEVRLRGLDPKQPASRSRLGYLPERLMLPAAATVESLLRLHATLAGLDGATCHEEVRRVMERVGLGDRAHERIAGLSKGLRQRVGFAQALVAEPSLLLLDEPTSGLDPIGIRDAREWIQEARQRGCTVLISSHVLSEVERLCDRIAILHEGRQIAEGSLEEILVEGETLEDAFVRIVGR